MSVEDVEAIRHLTASYNRAFDEDRAEDWANHFTEDGFFERSNAGRSYQGRAEIATLCSSFDYPVHGRHVTSDHMITVDGDTAKQTCYLMFLDRDAGFVVNLFAVYYDDLVKVDGKWLFKRRLCNVDDGSG
jgi:ketosteroid isomerase-like protein